MNKRIFPLALLAVLSTLTISCLLKNIIINNPFSNE